MFPIGDDNSDRTITPYVNYAIIGVNILVFALFQGFGGNDTFTYAFSLVPRAVTTGVDISGVQLVHDSLGHVGRIVLYQSPVSVYFNFLTSMFMHGGFAHIAGNMLFLWIFGDNIEDRLGHVKYVIFYLLCGVIAGLSHVFATGVFATSEASLLVPSLGASGAISGVLGAYILLHPKRRVTVILFRFLTDVPAYVAIGIWFAFQLISGLGMLGGGSQQGGVAYAAHIGGFLAGLILIKFFDPGKRQTEYYHP